MLKSHKELCKFDANSTNIYISTLNYKYTNGEINFDVSLANYAAYYNKKSRKVQDQNDNEGMQENEMVTKR